MRRVKAIAGIGEGEEGANSRYSFAALGLTKPPISTTPGVVSAGAISSAPEAAVAGAALCLSRVSLAKRGQSLVKKITKQMPISTQMMVAWPQYTGTRPIFKTKIQKATVPRVMGNSMPMDKMVESLVRPWLVKTPPVLHCTIMLAKVFNKTGNNNTEATPATPLSLVMVFAAR